MSVDPHVPIWLLVSFASEAYPRSCATGSAIDLRFDLQHFLCILTDFRVVLSFKMVSYVWLFASDALPCSPCFKLHSGDGGAEALADRYLYGAPLHLQLLQCEFKRASANFPRFSQFSYLASEYEPLFRKCSVCFVNLLWDWLYPQQVRFSWDTTAQAGAFLHNFAASCQEMWVDWNHC